MKGTCMWHDHAYLQQHPGYTGEWRAHLQQEGDHGQEVAQGIPHHRPHVSRQGEEMMRGQWEVEWPKYHTGGVKCNILKCKKARGCEHVKPWPVFLAPHFVSGDWGVFSEGPETGYCTLDPKHCPGGSKVPKNLFFGQQGLVGLAQRHGQEVTEEEHYSIEAEAKADELEAIVP